MAKSLIMNNEGVVCAVISLMHAEIDSPEQMADFYEFSSQKLRDTFIEGLRAGLAYHRALCQFITGLEVTSGN